jgi:hypothetical protein
MFINIFFSKCPMFKVASIFLILALMLIPILIPAAPVTLALGHRLSEGTNSLNWSGYAVTASSGTVTAVYGSWIVPSVSCSKQSTYVAFWAGIDGFNSNTVEQAGVLAQCSSGKAYYSAWYEFYPSPSVTISSITVAPGDTVSVSVSYSSGSFYITVKDGSQTYTTSGSVSGAQLSSAECITERPAIAGSLTKLADFGVVSFGYDYTKVSQTCYATISGNTAPFGSFTSLQSINMVDNRGAILAKPSTLSSDGSSFTVTWYRSN